MSSALPNYRDTGSTLLKNNLPANSITRLSADETNTKHKNLNFMRKKGNDVFFCLAENVSINLFIYLYEYIYTGSPPILDTLFTLQNAQDT